jgi:hypothetical protein
MEVKIPSLRILKEANIADTDWTEDRTLQLNLVDERRLNALHHANCYQKRVARAYQKKVRPREFLPGDMVLKAHHQLEAPGKFKPRWQGPFTIKKILTGGAAILQTVDGEEFPEPTNLCFLKKYYQ